LHELLEVKKLEGTIRYGTEMNQRHVTHPGFSTKKAEYDD
jgi:hypothetical protein